MKLSKRLLAIYSLIPDNVRIIDVGCDHAQLDIYSVFNKENITCLAIEKTEKTSLKAINSIKKYHMENTINVVANDGLKGIKIYDSDYVVIAGMGSFNILKILTDIDFCVKNLIIQSNTDNTILKNILVNNGFLLDKLIVVEEYKRYEIMKLSKK